MTTKQPVHDVVAARLGRARRWLDAALLVLVLMAAAAATLGFSAGSDGHGIALFALIMLPLPVMATRCSRRTPTDWRWLVGIGGLFLAVGLGGAVTAAEDGPTPVWLSLSVALPPAVLAGLLAIRADRIVLRPMVPELGASDLKLDFPLRAKVYTAAVRLAGHSLDIRVIDDLVGRTRWRRVVPLATIRAVTLRTVAAEGTSWLEGPKGRSLTLPPGEVVEVTYQAPDEPVRTLLLPVRDGTEFVGVLRTRLEHLRALGKQPAVTAAPAQWPTQPDRPPEDDPVTPVRPTLPPGPTGRSPTVRYALAAAIGAVAVLSVPIAVLALTGPSAGEWATGGGWIGAGGICWYLMRRTPRRWPGCALVSGLYPALLGLDEIGWEGPLALAASIALAAYPGRLLVTPLHPQLGDVDVELTVRTRGPLRLRIGADRLLLVPHRPRAGALPAGLPLGRLDLLQAGEYTGTPTSRVPGPEWTTVLTPGPALRIAGGGQQWLLAVADPRTVAEIVRRRAARAGDPPPPVEDPAQWRELQAWARRLRSGWLGGREVPHRYPDRWVWSAVPFAVGGSAIVPSGGTASAVGAGALAVGAAVLGRYLAIGPRMRRAEDQPIPPGGQPWGDQRPDRAPVPGWVPWI